MDSKSAMKTWVFLLPLFFVEIFAININFSLCNGNYYMGCSESEREAQASALKVEARSQVEQLH